MKQQLVFQFSKLLTHTDTFIVFSFSKDQLRLNLKSRLSIQQPCNHSSCSSDNFTLDVKKLFNLIVDLFVAGTESKGRQGHLPSSCLPFRTRNGSLKTHNGVKSILEFIPIFMHLHTYYVASFFALSHQGIFGHKKINSTSERISYNCVGFFCVAFSCLKM